MATVDFATLGLRHGSPAATIDTEPLATVLVMAGLKLTVIVPAVG
jgi:hypothetical protein